jgi:membrane protein involved in colicin uptake
VKPQPQQGPSEEDLEQWASEPYVPPPSAKRWDEEREREIDRLAAEYEEYKRSAQYAEDRAEAERMRVAEEERKRVAEIEAEAKRIAREVADAATPASMKRKREAAERLKTESSVPSISVPIAENVPVPVLGEAQRAFAEGMQPPPRKTTRNRSKPTE